MFIAFNLNEKKLVSFYDEINHSLASAFNVFNLIELLVKKMLLHQ